MRIAQVAPLYESVPPKLYGGTERVVSYLTEALVEAGHDVTLFASGDSETAARLVSCCDKSLRLNHHDCKDQLAHHFVMLDKVLESADRFDIIHFHCDYLHFPLVKVTGLTHVATLHGRLDSPDLLPLYRRYKDMPLTSISLNQRKPLAFANWVGNVYHGLPANLLPIGNGSGGYLAFLGRISKEKRVDRAIEIACRVGIPLKIAAKIDPADREYYESIKHLLDSADVEFVGEINEQQKSDFLGNAFAYLFPIDWPEPFGLTMIESMACGTPTIAFNCGSVPEVITENLTGFIVSSIEEAVDALSKLRGGFDRAACRAEFLRRFSAPKMAREYVKVYEAVVSREALAATRPASEPTSAEIDTLLTL